MTDRDRRDVRGPLPLDAGVPSSSFSELLAAQGSYKRLHDLQFN